VTERILTHYKVFEEISRGGMGVVYRAVDMKLDREVAIKVLPPELVADPERKRRFVQEAKAAAALHHPHIATIFEIDEADDTTFIAMELIRGKKLGELFEGERPPLGRILEIATEIVEGLARAHEKGIVHRDLKPGNLMLTEDEHVKIIDFGLAKLIEPMGSADMNSLEDTALRQTESGKILGTVSYMSPEQAPPLSSCDRRPSRRTDRSSPIRADAASSRTSGACRFSLNERPSGPTPSN
jgi:serine/threonine protein kinase